MRILNKAPPLYPKSIHVSMRRTGARRRSACHVQPATRAHTQPQTHTPAAAADADAAAPAARVAR
eukprot:1277810-Prymnesium_polylepis.1